ncbi:hypothetical protein T265_01456 [Opisthorchis viverrini]|uniref:Uncharacterized protein n=1 Tax=Opisthorchis viverrini TaxID=6198 RepID=A0A075A2W1_OPIVI|nr:hypothetical protein T265_01456 [Opisthorchis viverrini]KER32587.1 hypothetical protein T265_01456 [Opisthorchis viverrini]
MPIDHRWSAKLLLKLFNRSHFLNVDVDTVGYAISKADVPACIRTTPPSKGQGMCVAQSELDLVVLLSWLYIMVGELSMLRRGVPTLCAAERSTKKEQQNNYFTPITGSAREPAKTDSSPSHLSDSDGVICLSLELASM